MAFPSALRHPWRTLARRLLHGWLEFRLVEPDPAHLDLDREHPVFYVLPHASLSDMLALELLCRRQALPPAAGRVAAGDVQLPACFALPRLKRGLGGLKGNRSRPLETLVESLQRHPDSEVQLVPVSVFWGRAPGKDFGFWKLLAADSWQWSGRLRRLLSVLINGKSVEVHLGEPVRLRQLLDERPAALTQRKVARVLRVHFRRVRTRVLGPDISHRRTLIRGVVASPDVRQAIGDTCSQRASSLERETRQAWRYGQEIASNMSYPVLRFMYQLLRRVWNRLYDGVDVHGLDAVKTLAGDKEIIYVPCHRSHIDYLLLSYVLYREGLMPPHIAAGRNLDMPVIGALLRRGGAFFMRRSFRDNRLYSAVFNEYVHRLISRGHPVEYFIEGGRSRTGRMLTPRPGMLAMTLRSFIRDTRRDVAFVPVYIGYEKVVESASYLKELRGASKRKESPLDLLRVVGQLRQPFGRVSVNIGAPLSLTDFLDAGVVDWRAPHRTGRPAWLKQAVPALGEELARRINAAATLNPVSLVSITLLATPHRAIEADLLRQHMALLVRLQRQFPGGEQVILPQGTARDWIAHVAHLGFIERRTQALGELVLASPEQATSLTWYRNNILHLFAFPGLVAFAFRNNARFTLEELVGLLELTWPVLAREFYLRTPDDLAAHAKACLETLQHEGLLVREDERWSRPTRDLGASEQLRLLGQPVQPTLERGYLLLATLLRHASGELSREALEEHSHQLAERLTLLSGLNAPEFFDKRLFSGLLDTLEAYGWLWQEDGQLCYGEALENAQHRVRALFDPMLRQRLGQLTRQP
ncbi:glycerol-3-phosphate 1-O-acyltransferase PlsB [Halomonas sp. WWR20]